MDLKAEKELRPVDPPRRRLHPMSVNDVVATMWNDPKNHWKVQRYKGTPISTRDKHEAKTSLRKFAKLNLSSAQGEILSGDEMTSIIQGYKYKAKFDRTGDLAAKKAFVKACLDRVCRLSSPIGMAQKVFQLKNAKRLRHTGR